MWCGVKYAWGAAWGRRGTNNRPARINHDFRRLISAEVAIRAFHHLLGVVAALQQIGKCLALLAHSLFDFLPVNVRVCDFKLYVGLHCFYYVFIFFALMGYHMLLVSFY